MDRGGNFTEKDHLIVIEGMTELEKSSFCNHQFIITDSGKDHQRFLQKGSCWKIPQSQIIVLPIISDKGTMVPL